MKTVFFFVVIFAVVALGSCKKEDPMVIISDSARIEQIRQEIAQNPNKFAITEQTILDLYREKTGGLKGALIAPKVGFSAPSNEVILSLDGSFTLVQIWTIVNNECLIDRGVITRHYYRDVEKVDVQFLIGWENEFCVPVSFTPDAQNNCQTRITLSYRTSFGNFSFDLYTDGQEGSFKIYLPQLDFDGVWENYSNISRGGTFSFNPLGQSEVILPVMSGMKTNIKYYLRFYLPGDVVPNSKVTLYIENGKGEGDRTTIVLSDGKTIPGSVDLPLTFIPIQVSYQVITYNNGMAEYGDYITRECTLDPSGPMNGNIYVLK